MTTNATPWRRFIPTTGPDGALIRKLNDHEGIRQLREQRKLIRQQRETPTPDSQS